MRPLLIVLLLMMLAGCSDLKERVVEVLPAPSATAPAGAPTPGAQPPAPAAGGWQELQAGLAWREIDLGVTNAQVVRVDPALLRVRVAYDAGSPGRVSEWMRALKPLLVINGGYFDNQGRATALTIYDGVSYGASYEGFGGMLAVDSAGTLAIRSLREQPYESGEDLAQALQSTPMLVLDGAVVPQPNDDGDRARRTVVATDGAGHLLAIVIGWPVYTLSELAAWLAASDLGIVNALNLDGGSSTGLSLASGAASLEIDSLVRVPQVLLVENR